MNSIQEKFKTAAKMFVGKMVEQDAREWPPTCLIMAYQPDRPYQQADFEQLTDDELSISLANKD